MTEKQTPVPTRTVQVIVDPNGVALAVTTSAEVVDAAVNAGYVVYTQLPQIIDADDFAAWHAPTRTVQIPASTNHDGQHFVTVTVPWVCPPCGGPRGPVVPAISYDGSRRLSCDGWENPCGHIDYYDTVRAQARTAAAGQR